MSRGVRTGNPSGLTHLAVASKRQASAWMQPALAKKLARRFGEEATKEVLCVHSLTCKTETWPNT